MKNPKLTDRTAPEHQTIAELWASLEQFAMNRVLDNQRYGGEYPIDTRIAQMPALRSLVGAIEQFHEKYTRTCHWD